MTDGGQVRILYRGCGVSVFGAAPVYGVYFGSYEVPLRLG